MPSRALLYVYSNKNIAGCVLGLAALGGFFTGVIHDYWFEIVAAAYGIGALATPSQPKLDTDLETSMSSQQNDVSDVVRVHQSLRRSTNNDEVVPSKATRW